MNKHVNQSGDINILLVPFVFMTLFFIGAASFGVWAFMQRQDYKDNADQKVAAAIEVARKDEGIVKDKAFAESEKQPLIAYNGPDTYGGIEVMYPKTWSVYINSTANQPLNAYLHPKLVPSVNDTDAVYALRVQVLPQAYAAVVKNLSGGVKTGKVMAAPFSLSKVPEVVGTRFDGLINANKKSTGSMIVLPLRDKTIEISTESPEYLADFNDIILPNVTFSP